MIRRTSARRGAPPTSCEHSGMARPSGRRALVGNPPYRPDRRIPIGFGPHHTEGHREVDGDELHAAQAARGRAVDPLLPDPGPAQPDPLTVPGGAGWISRTVLDPAGVSAT